MLESGEFATVAELAEREAIAPSYMTRVLRLTLLAPDIVETILHGSHPPELTIARLLEPFGLHWHEQAGDLLTLRRDERRAKEIANATGSLRT
jgi:hypothetical protein